MSNQAESPLSNVKRAPAAPEQRSNVAGVRSAADQRQVMIAEAAYYLALQRKFDLGMNSRTGFLRKARSHRASHPGSPPAKPAMRRTHPMVFTRRTPPHWG